MPMSDIGSKIVSSENSCALLLQVMADPEDSGASSVSTALVEACKNRDIGMADLLLRHSARDDDCKALRIAARHKDAILIAKLLSIKVQPSSNPTLHFNAWRISGMGVLLSESYKTPCPVLQGCELNHPQSSYLQDNISWRYLSGYWSEPPCMSLVHWSPWAFLEVWSLPQRYYLQTLAS